MWFKRKPKKTKTKTKTQKKKNKVMKQFDAKAQPVTQHFPIIEKLGSYQQDSLVGVTRTVFVMVEGPCLFGYHLPNLNNQTVYFAHGLHSHILFGTEMNVDFEEALLHFYSCVFTFVCQS